MAGKDYRKGISLVGLMRELIADNGLYSGVRT